MDQPAGPFIAFMRNIPRLYDEYKVDLKDPAIISAMRTICAMHNSALVSDRIPSDNRGYIMLGLYDSVDRDTGNTVRRFNNVPITQSYAGYKSLEACFGNLLSEKVHF